MRYKFDLSAQQVEVISEALSKLKAKRPVVETINIISAQIAEQNKAIREAEKGKKHGRTDN